MIKNVYPAHMITDYAYYKKFLKEHGFKLSIDGRDFYINDEAGDGSLVENTDSIEIIHGFCEGIKRLKQRKAPRRKK